MSTTTPAGLDDRTLTLLLRGIIALFHRHPSTLEDEFPSEFVPHVRVPMGDGMHVNLIPLTERVMVGEVEDGLLVASERLAAGLEAAAERLAASVTDFRRQAMTTGRITVKEGEAEFTLDFGAPVPTGKTLWGPTPLGLEIGLEGDDWPGPVAMAEVHEGQLWVFASASVLPCPA